MQMCLQDINFEEAKHTNKSNEAKSGRLIHF